MANHYLIVLNGINNDGRKLRNSFLGVRMSTNDCSSSAHEIIKGSTNMAGNLAKCYTYISDRDEKQPRFYLDHHGMCG